MSLPSENSAFVLEGTFSYQTSQETGSEVLLMSTGDVSCVKSKQEGTRGVTVVSVYPVFNGLVARLPGGQVPCRVALVGASPCANIL